MLEDAKSKICVSVFAEHIDDIDYFDNSYDFIELRLDNIKQEQFQLFSKLFYKSIVTYRNIMLSDSDKLLIHKVIIKFSPLYIDIDFNMDKSIVDNLVSICKFNNINIVLSYHNYEYTPKYLEIKDIYNIMLTYNPDIIKIVAMANCDKDLEEISKIYGDTSESKLIAFNMGIIGKSSRINALHKGAPFMFAKHNSLPATGDGQYTYSELLNILGE